MSDAFDLDPILDVRVGDWLRGLAPTATYEELVALRGRLEKVATPSDPRVGLDAMVYGPDAANERRWSERGSDQERESGSVGNE